MTIVLLQLAFTTTKTAVRKQSEKQTAKIARDCTATTKTPPTSILHCKTTHHYLFPTKLHITTSFQLTPVIAPCRVTSSSRWQRNLPSVGHKTPIQQRANSNNGVKYENMMVYTCLCDKLIALPLLEMLPEVLKVVEVSSFTSAITLPAEFPRKSIKFTVLDQAPKRACSSPTSAWRRGS